MTAGFGVDTSAPQSLVIQVEQVNDAPSGLLGCGAASHAPGLRSCTAKCVQNAKIPRCNLTMVIAQDNQDAARFPFNLSEIITRVAPSPFDAVDERTQAISFLLEPLQQSDSVSESFLLDQRPVLYLESATNGSLSALVKQHRSGHINYAVFILDDGGGKERYHAGNLLISIEPSNRAPYFDLCGSCPAGPLMNTQRCCDGDVLVRESSGRVNVVDFATNISAGRIWTQDGVIMHESQQNFTFSVLVDGKEDVFVQGGAPVIHTNGTLTFYLRDGFQGSVSCLLSLEDDGSTFLGGANHSLARSFTLFAVGNAIQAEMFINTSTILTTQENVESLIKFFSDQFGVKPFFLHLNVSLQSEHENTGTYRIAITQLFGLSMQDSLSHLEKICSDCPESPILAALQDKYGSLDIDIGVAQISRSAAKASTFQMENTLIELVETSSESETVRRDFFSDIFQSDAEVRKCEASVTCSGTCACPNSKTSETGVISDGPGNYPPGSNCSWIISSGSQDRLYYCADIQVQFDEFDTEAGYDFVVVYSCSSQNCHNRTELARLDGNAGTCKSDALWAGDEMCVCVCARARARVCLKGFITVLKPYTVCWQMQLANSALRMTAAKRLAQRQPNTQSMGAVQRKCVAGAGGDLQTRQLVTYTRPLRGSSRSPSRATMCPLRSLGILVSGLAGTWLTMVVSR